MLLKDITTCSTIAVKKLDEQLIAEMNSIQPNLLVRIDDLKVEIGEGCHPWLQAPAKTSLKQAIAYAGRKLIINSAFRTLAGQMLLRKHFENGACGILAAAEPGASNHNRASAIDIEDADTWRSALEASGWRKLGNFDPMHYDCVSGRLQDIGKLSVIAFQKLWNRHNPQDLIAVDGGFGAETRQKLLDSPAEGWE